MSSRALLCAMPSFVLLLCVSATANADESWSARQGSTSLTLDVQSLDRFGISIDCKDANGGQDGPQLLVLEVDSPTDLAFVVKRGNLDAIGKGKAVHKGALVFKTPRTRIVMDRPTIQSSFRSNDATGLVMQGHSGSAGLVLERVKTAFDPETGTLRLHCPAVRISGALAEALGDPTLKNLVIGQLTAEWHAEWLGGDTPYHPPVANDGGGGVRGPGGADMTFCQLYGLYQAGRLGHIVGLSVGTTSWNIGDEDLMWFAEPGTQHPFIVMNLYRLKNEQFEQIGQSWVKHGFYALGSTQCATPCRYEPGHGSGDWLGTGCTDTYSAGLNASQNGLSPRSEVNPWTGEWTYAGSHLSEPYHSHDGIEHRIQVDDSDLYSVSNPGATYYVEGYYAVTDDINVMNSAAWKPVTVSGVPNGTWTFGLTGASTAPEIGFALDAWTGATQSMIAQEVPPVEFVSPDGRCVLAAKATDLGGGTWHYEYALLNIDMDRKVKSFQIPNTAGTTITNVGFHAVQSHDESYSNTAWTAVINDNDITWSTTDNPLRWGTLYNFRFNATAPPDSQVNVTLGLHEPGTPTTLSGVSIGPSGGPGGNAVRGGTLWDQWWTVIGAPAPTGNHPLYPPIGQKSGSTTFRCNECHGWDYKGVDGVYGTGSHYTGIPGVFGSSMSAAEMSDLLKYDAPPFGHGFANYGMTDEDITDLVQFIMDQVVDTDTYIDAAGNFVGNAAMGQVNYETQGFVACVACHGSDGAAINFGTPERPEWVGTVAERNPWELLHKTRFGQPGNGMPSWVEWGGTTQGAADLGRYAQVAFPVDCIDAAVCDDGDPCNGIELCVNGHCTASTLDGDLNLDGATDGRDLDLFVSGVIAQSSDPVLCAHGDFSGNGVVDLDDSSCMVSGLLGP